jgi:6,7-dimethyl-8-ribityllumazine synthase
MKELEKNLSGANLRVGIAQARFNCWRHAAKG